MLYIISTYIDWVSAHATIYCPTFIGILCNKEGQRDESDKKEQKCAEQSRMLYEPKMVESCS